MQHVMKIYVNLFQKNKHYFKNHLIEKENKMNNYQIHQKVNKMNKMN